jgi:hypothetical protein
MAMKHSSTEHSSMHSLDPPSLLLEPADLSRQDSHMVLHSLAGTIIECPGKPSISSHYIVDMDSHPIVQTSQWSAMIRGYTTVSTPWILEFSNIHNQNCPSKHLRLSKRVLPPTLQQCPHAYLQACFNGGGQATESYSATVDASVDSTHLPGTSSATHFLT